jgi:hypothetical protein
MTCLLKVLVPDWWNGRRARSRPVSLIGWEFKSLIGHQKFMNIIHQHPEWKIVEDWFVKRANGNYSHTEKVEVSSSIDPEIVTAATEMGRAFGASVQKILTLSFNGQDCGLLSR